MRTQLLLMAKAPVPGRVKTRLCPPCTPEGAAGIAAAALADTVDVVTAAPAARRVLVLAGAYPTPPGWRRAAQRGDGLGERLAAAFADTAARGVASLLIGMDTPQVTVARLAEVAAGLDAADAVLAPAADGGWWALALRDPGHAGVLAGVPMSTATTGAETAAALYRLGLVVSIGPTLRDVDVAADARAVAALAPDGRFAAAVHRHLDAPVGAR
jgi:uncharacterized protein